METPLETQQHPQAHPQSFFYILFLPCLPCVPFLSAAFLILIWRIVSLKLFRKSIRDFSHLRLLMCSSKGSGDAGRSALFITASIYVGFPFTRRSPAHLFATRLARVSSDASSIVVEALPTAQKLLAIEALANCSAILSHTHAHAKNKHACHKSKQACHKHTSDDR